ncbi:unnamed protein product [Paramecium sonneborni]|uniref:Pseudouridine-5'-phosphate glycosidase n=1 Tax=Paramecium sonneborni TaxID=65129 RepID=A0A8S1RSX0_9CILI|nr:unnamed protein product [Paramecium sonneborni]
MEKLLQISQQVREAIEKGQAVVALESTIITHGMEYPTNVQTALGVEEEIRAQGAIPATIIITQGVLRVGLSQEEIEEIGKNKHQYQKCSRRDLAQIIAQKGNGSTTVAATMMIAHMAGIKVFVTGGIGGVHRGAEHTFDISADLVELGQPQVAVVCAGAKSILGIPKTLEYLETQGVPVVGYKTKHFPNFFTPDFRFFFQEASELIKAQFDLLKLKNGILFCVPIPQDQAADGQIVQQAIDKALKELDEQNINGALVTPFLLKRVNEITDGMSSKSNVALIRNNARVGAEIAIQLLQKRLVYIQQVKIIYYISVILINLLLLSYTTINLKSDTMSKIIDNCKNKFLDLNNINYTNQDWKNTILDFYQDLIFLNIWDIINMLYKQLFA